MNKKITVNTTQGPIDITTGNERVYVDMRRHRHGHDDAIFALSSSDARTIARVLNEFADKHGSGVKPLRDSHSLLLALVECMSTFADNDPASIERTQAALLEYERSGDHNHGRGPIAPGGKCDSGACWVGKVRAELAALKKVK